MGEKYAKNARTLDMYERLREGKSIRKCEEAQRFGVDERSIQRDIDDIRAFLDERQMQGDGRQVIYDRAKKALARVRRAQKLADAEHGTQRLQNLLIRDPRKKRRDRLRIPL